jgi:hypothetical protein
MPKKLKRPRDANQLAKMIVDIAVGDLTEEEPKDEPTRGAKLLKPESQAPSVSDQ